MKAKLYIGLISAMMLSGFSAKAQMADAREHGTGMEYNNRGDYDYYYSSRINRFHRQYSTFTYFSPAYTDSYWYSSQPYSWGMSIYGGSVGFGAGYPSYSSYGWNTPYYGDSFYYGSNPNYYGGWYSPVVVSINLGGWWPRAYYGWHGHNDYYYGNNHNNYYNNNYYNNNYNNNYNNQ